MREDSSRANSGGRAEPRSYNNHHIDGLEHRPSKLPEESHAHNYDPAFFSTEACKHTHGLGFESVIGYFRKLFWILDIFSEYNILFGNLLWICYSGIWIWYHNNEKLDMTQCCLFEHRSGKKATRIILILSFCGIICGSFARGHFNGS